MLKLPLKPGDFVEDVVLQFSTASSFLRQRGIVCVQCGEPVWGTLGEVIEAKDQDVDQVMTALNKHLEAERSSQTP